MSRGSAPGERRGGRRRGTPNRRTPALRALAEGSSQAGSPLEFLESVYRNEAPPIALRIEAASKAAPYIHPRLAAVAVSDTPETPINAVSHIEIVLVKPPSRAICHDGVSVAGARKTPL